MGNPNYEAKANPSVTLYSEASRGVRAETLSGSMTFRFQLPRGSKP